MAEAAAALAWYSERSLRAPLAFAAEIDKALEAISVAPERWPVFEADAGASRCTVFLTLLFTGKSQKDSCKSWRWPTQDENRVTGANEARPFEARPFFEKHCLMEIKSLGVVGADIMGNIIALRIRDGIGPT